MEGHTILPVEAKGIGFSEKWGAYLGYNTVTLDLIKGEGTRAGYIHYTFPDGSTYDRSGKVRAERSAAEGTWTYIKGTGKFEGIQGGGTWKSLQHGPRPVVLGYRRGSTRSRRDLVNPSDRL